jgi:hypothetical protein
MDIDGLERIDGILGGVLKEILRRAELRTCLETERGRPLSDQEFLTIAEWTGLRI